MLLLGLFAALPTLLPPAGFGAEPMLKGCDNPRELTSLDAPLPHTAARFRAGGPLTIVALGSSSTQGVGASRPEFTYPSRLAAVLQGRFPDVAIRVVNRGVRGEVAPQMLSRLDRDVLAEKPDLVIWQLGTNSVLHDLDPTAEIASTRQGIERLRAAGADVMLMDLQYAPAVLAHPRYREMLRILAALARSEEVPLFRRFAVMRHWAEDDHMPLPSILAEDRLHMSDSSYDCLARDVAQSILDAVGLHG